MEVIISDSPEHEGLFADICYESVCWARLLLDPKRKIFVLEIFPPSKGEDYTFALNHVQTALNRAKSRLEELGYNEQ